MTFRSCTDLTTKQWLATILVAAFLLTFGYALHFKIVPVVDAAHYQSIATNIAAGAGYRMDQHTPLADDVAIASLGPLYEFFLALLFSLFHHSLAAVWFVQTLLDMATGLLLFLIARRTFGEDGERTGLIAAGLYLFCIDIIQMPAMLMTETLFLFWLAFTTYSFVRFYQTPSYTNAALIGITSAFTIMTRPTALLLLALILLYAILVRRYKQALLVLVCAALIIAPWTVRNYYVYHSFILTTAAGGYDLWLGNNPDADGGAHPTPEMVSYGKTHTFTQVSAYGTEQFKNFIFGHPFEETGLLMQKSVSYFSVARPYGFWFYLSGLPQKIVLAWSALWSLLLFVFGLSGAWLLWQSKKPLNRWLVAFAILMPASVIPIIVETRYRLPIYPFLALFGGYFVARWYRLHKEASHDWSFIKILAIASVFIVAIAAIDVFRNIALILSRLGL